MLAAAVALETPSSDLTWIFYDQIDDVESAANSPTRIGCHPSRTAGG